MGISHDTVETVSESGWSNSEIFLDYLKYHFISHILAPGNTAYDGTQFPLAFPRHHIIVMMDDFPDLLDYLKYHFIKYINILKQKVLLLLDEHT
jgi:hypothetical protein